MSAFYAAAAAAAAAGRSEVGPAALPEVSAAATRSTDPRTKASSLAQGQAILVRGSEARHMRIKLELSHSLLPFQQAAVSGSSD